MKLTRQDLALLACALGFYAIFLYFNQPVDYETCQLCDGRQYLKLYWFFENGTIDQIVYPFYTRPAIPLLASLIPGNDAYLAFHIVNFVFILLGVFAIKKLWDYLTIKNPLQIVGLSWLILHWSGLMRNNLRDFVTVDVPLYALQALSLLLFLKNRFKWFYLLAPFAILQKESFIGIMLVFVLAHIWDSEGLWFKEGQHLLYATLLGVGLNFLVIELLPEQNHKWHPLLTVLLLLKMTLDDPSRLIRWFVAFGSAFGLIPLISMFQLRKHFGNNSSERVLILLSGLYLGFGLLAGGDMTRILFLGFPFIMTLSLISLQRESNWTLLIVLLFSVVSLRLTSLSHQNSWALDYRELEHVLNWAIYYGVATLLLLLYWLRVRESNKLQNPL